MISISSGQLLDLTLDNLSVKCVRKGAIGKQKNTLTSVRVSVCVSGADIELRDIMDGELNWPEFKV
jgi:hypothetical protein